MESLGVPSRMSHFGVTEDSIAAMAEDAMRSGNVKANPRKSTRGDIADIYRGAL